MKTYTFKSTKNNQNTAEKSLNAMLAEKILEFAPYLKKDKSTKKTIDIDITIPKKKLASANTLNGVKIDDFIDACAFLSKYKGVHAFNSCKDEYDFELSDGTPVRIFDDEIQIGYTLIPMEWFIEPNEYLSAFTPKKKKMIVDIAVKLAA